MGTKPLWSSRAFVLPAGLAVVVAAACGGTKTDNNNQSTGGTSGWTFLPPGTGTGGSPSAGAGGVAGGAGGGGGSAGSAASAGSGGVGGSSVSMPKPFACNGEVPNQPLITHFDGFMKDRWVSP